MVKKNLLGPPHFHKRRGALSLRITMQVSKFAFATVLFGLCTICYGHSHVRGVGRAPRLSTAILAGGSRNNPRKADGLQILRLKGGEGEAKNPECGKRLRIALCAWESLHSIAVRDIPLLVTCSPDGVFIFRAQCGASLSHRLEEWLLT